MSPLHGENCLVYRAIKKICDQKNINHTIKRKFCGNQLLAPNFLQRMVDHTFLWNQISEIWSCVLARKRCRFNNPEKPRRCLVGCGLWFGTDLAGVGATVDAGHLDVAVDRTGNDLNSLEVTGKNHNITAGSIRLQKPMGKQ